MPIGAGIRAMQDISLMKESIKTGEFLETSVLSFVKTEDSELGMLSDLRHPALKDIKNSLFTFFGLDGSKSYVENLEIYETIKEK